MGVLRRYAAKEFFLCEVVGWFETGPAQVVRTLLLALLISGGGLLLAVSLTHSTTQLEQIKINENEKKRERERQRENTPHQQEEGA